MNCLIIWWKSCLIFDISKLLIVIFRKVGPFNLCRWLRLKIWGWGLDSISNRCNYFFFNSFWLLLDSIIRWFTSSRCNSSNFFLFNSFLFYLIVIFIWIFNNLFGRFLRNLFPLWFLNCWRDFFLYFSWRCDWRWRWRCLLFGMIGIPFLNFLIKLINHVLDIF